MFYKISGIILLAFIALCLSIYKPWVVKDPKDPNFDPMKFEYQFYGSDESLEAVLSIIFKPGMNKEYVDKVLLSKPFTSFYKDRKRNNYITYYGENQYPLRLIWNKSRSVVGVLYSEDNKVVDIFVHSRKSIFNGWDLRNLSRRQRPCILTKEDNMTGLILTQARMYA